MGYRHVRQGDDIAHDWGTSSCRDVHDAACSGSAWVDLWGAGVKTPGKAAATTRRSIAGSSGGQTTGDVETVMALGLARDSQIMATIATAPHKQDAVACQVHGSGRYRLTPRRRPEIRNPTTDPMIPATMSTAPMC